LPRQHNFARFGAPFASAILRNDSRCVFLA
jgi:hypothetical protein